MTVVAFKTKTEVFAFCDEWRGMGGKARVIPTPKEIKIGCGFAVEINSASLSSAYNFVKGGYFPTFIGIFTIKKIAGKTLVQKTL